MFFSITLCKSISKVFDRLLIKPVFGPDVLSEILLSNIDELEDRAKSYLSGEKSGGSFALYHRVVEMDIEKGKAIWGNYFQSERALPIEKFSSKIAQSEIT